MKVFRQSTHFATRVQAGKKALKGEHRKLLIESSQAKVTGSLDFEKAVEGIQSQEKRWDYFIEAQGVDTVVHAVEVHEFDRSVLVQKKAGTLAILNEVCAPAKEAVKSWHVLVVGDLPRIDLIARFKAETKIQVSRQLNISKL